MSQLKSLVEMLSKSSAEAVATLGQSNPQAKKLKTYLYVKTNVEKDLQKKLEGSTAKRIVFLCGSSGDGKSEIFKRIHRKFKVSYDFHLDATHSFHPSKNAVQTLDEKFAQFKSGDIPLVVGINIGMLGNYSAEGDEQHGDIKHSISKFLAATHPSNPRYEFINFEDYPKFELDGEKVTAPFIDKLLAKICSDSDKNPLFTEYKKNKKTRLARNFTLLRIPEVRSKISDLLFYAHLKFDQFLTARSILDLVNQVLIGKGNLFDNLFCGQGTELLQSLAKLDPCHTRTKRLDLFQVKSELGLAELDSRSWVRLFYMLQDVNLGNNFHHEFRHDLASDLFKLYINVWQLHRDYDGDRDMKKRIRDFYQKVFVAAVSSFANRFAPELGRDRFLLARPNGFSLSARAKVEPSFGRIKDFPPPSLRDFPVFLDLEREELYPAPVSIKFLELVQKINLGYRPNTHDKTAVVVLEELVELIRRKVRGTEVLYVGHGKTEWSIVDDKRDDEFFVDRK
jgi:DNA phosphorothioation-dependent restriction protein DptF